MELFAGSFGYAIAKHAVGSNASRYFTEIHRSLVVNQCD